MRIPITGDPKIDAATIAWAKRLIAAEEKAKVLRKAAFARVLLEKQRFRVRIYRIRAKMRRFWSKVTKMTPRARF